MKKLISILLSLTLLLSLTSCGTLNFANIEEFSSAVYTERDIADAMEVVLEWFYGKTDMMLMNVSYIGDENLADFKEWADRNNADEVIVILTDFYISPFSDNPVMTSGAKYKAYSWILVRTSGGEWEIVDQGY